MSSPNLPHNPPHNPIDILLDHNLWATRQVLDACAALSPEQFHRRFEMGVGSLHDTARHILGAMRVWTDLLAGRAYRPRLEDGPQLAISELIALLDDAAADLKRHAHAHPLDGTVTRERGGRSYTFTRGAVLTHVATHGMHHRAQMLNMLRHLGVSVLPQSSVVEWCRALS
ncbi:MAG: DinB family protein [Phycisphaeraceae bacterium]|nr:DinB family protein [Phycisphaerales bacterium]QOJ17079.1 MAG: DinB family protein [Phycisphaeraceae bacterium]